MKSFILPALILSLLPMAATAQQASPAETPTITAAPEAAVVKNAGAKEKKECRSEEVTGSRFKKKICFTPEQWAERDRHTREFMQELDSRAVKRDGNGGI